MNNDSIHNNQEDSDLVSELEQAVNQSDDLEIDNSVADIDEKTASLNSEYEKFKDLYIRTQAEIQNIQKRHQDELKKARDYAISSFVKDIIVVKDYLEMALKDKSGNFDAMQTGVDLTLKQLIQVFSKHLVKDVDPKRGDKLDPHLHQAMSSSKDPELSNNLIVETMQKGYQLGDRVIRPAMVVVAE